MTLDPGADRTGHVAKATAVGLDRNDACELPHEFTPAIVPRGSLRNAATPSP